MMRRHLEHWRGPLAATLVLVILIAAASFFVTEQINRAEESESFVRLAEEAERLAESLEQNMSSDREMLGLIAKVMAQSPDEPARFLGLYQRAGTFFSRLELLLPGDLVVTADGTRIDTSGQLSFEQEAAQGAHVSDRELDWNGESYVVRHFVPVRGANGIAAMLYGVIELGGLGWELPDSPYGGEAAVYVIDGATGDFLVDTWHAEMGNIWALGERPMADGYDHEQLRQGLIDGESNYVVFVSNTTGEHLYFYYTPLNINQWRVALSVPEDVVFAGAREIRLQLNLFLAGECICFLGYIVWMVFYVRRETGEKQRQLDALHDIYNVEKLLFNAHEHRENISKSLAVIARMLPARRVAFTMFSSEGPALNYLWEEGGQTSLGASQAEQAQTLAAYFAKGPAELSARSMQKVRAILPDVPEGLGDLAAIPVEDADGAVLGILSASGLSRRAGCAAMLKSVGFSFARLCGNARTYQEMQRQGERDTLTGLYNRNRYEQDLPHVAGACQNGLCCIYIDANGLHELNNCRGHGAGDHMLRTIAEELIQRFDGQHVYRVGGDEFVVFLPDGDGETAAHHCRDLAAALEREGYHVSAGAAWASAPVTDMEGLIKAAEQRMYAAKQAYYRDPQHDRRAR